MLSLPLLFSPESLSLRAYLMNPPTQRDFIFYALMLAAFYLNYYGLIPRFYFSRRYLLLLLINIGCFMLINFLAGHLIRPGSIEGVRNKTIYLKGQEIPIGVSYEKEFFTRFSTQR